MGDDCSSVGEWLPEVVPTEGALDGFRFVALTPELVEQDFAALMADPESLNRWSGSTWPTSDFTLHENLIDLQMHEREQIERIALTYSVLIDDIVRGCIYVRPAKDAMKTRGVDPSASTLPTSHAVVRGWLHGVPASSLIATTVAWLSRPPFTFPRIWWQANEHTQDQLAACADLGLTNLLSFEGDGTLWLLASTPETQNPGERPTIGMR